jgi:uncharacterized protein with LGFP repeats
MGPIEEKYAKAGGPTGALGVAADVETIAPDKLGAMRHYANGSIYWHPSTGAHIVKGAIRQKWAALGWQTGILGYPTTDEESTPDGIARYNQFQGGTIVWHPKLGTFETHGLIWQKWLKMGGVKGILGLPTSDENKTSDGIARCSHFQQGSVYYHPKFGTFEVHGLIRSHWATLGWEKSFLGYPLSDELPTPDGKGRYNQFQGGRLVWTPEKGVVLVDQKP